MSAGRPVRVATYVCGALAGEAAQLAVASFRVGGLGDTDVVGLVIGGLMLAPLYVLTGLIPFGLLRHMAPAQWPARSTFLIGLLAPAVFLFNFLTGTVGASLFLSTEPRCAFLENAVARLGLDLSVGWPEHLAYVAAAGLAFVLVDRNIVGPSADVGGGSQTGL